MRRKLPIIVLMLSLQLGHFAARLDLHRSVRSPLVTAVATRRWRALES